MNLSRDLKTDSCLVTKNRYFTRIESNTDKDIVKVKWEDSVRNELASEVVLGKRLIKRFFCIVVHHKILPVKF